MKHVSRFISFILRHAPQSIGLEMDKFGWVNVNELIEKSKNPENDFEFTFETLKEIVATSDKQRFSFNEDLTKIRANQGHTFEVDLGLEPKTPPDVLYHGTSTDSINCILESGIIKQKRMHVHLSELYDTAISVGKRHGKPVVIKIDAKKMFSEGFEFFQSENGVWLTDIVKPEFMSI